MTTTELFLSSWDFRPGAIAICASLAVLYLLTNKKRSGLKTFNFMAGVLLILFSLVSPLETLGHHYLFSAHMVQHMLLGSVAPPLLVAGLTEDSVRTCLNHAWCVSLDRLFSLPAFALAVRIAVLVIWHLPAPFQSAMSNPSIHVTEQLSFLLSGLLLWWPVFKPVPEGKLPPLYAIAYIALAGFACSIMGSLFTICDTTLYSMYSRPHDPLGALDLIRSQWGLSQLEDQQLGGAIMWEPGCFIFLWAAMAVFLDWLKQSGKDTFVEHREV
ncbi:MAG TPA: cytochrome c oxidase assembly protein, partial [Chroococcales cyanobacterium]